MDVDVVIVGAGFAELCMLQHTQSMGLSARVFEQGGGGTAPGTQRPLKVRNIEILANCESLIARAKTGD
jgi:ribulose 1,5-bisphosphate synthetase/thiazole synthase